MRLQTAQETLEAELIQQAIYRNILSVTDSRITYKLHHQKTYNWNDPEEWVRAWTISWLIIVKGYPPNRLKTEVTVPRRTPNDFADIVVYSDDLCRTPYLVVENKAYGRSLADRAQGVEQLFGNTNSLRAPLALYDEGGYSALFDVSGFPPPPREPKTNLAFATESLRSTEIFHSIFMCLAKQTTFSQLIRLH
jgi:type I restriction enzyme M protein